MNDNVKLWLEELRSGEYEQGIGSLRNGETFCCLGVACEAYRKTTGKGKWVPFAPGDAVYIFNGEISASTAVLPFEVKNWLGLQTEGGRWHNEDGSALYIENDENHKTFDQIADIIESEPEGLLCPAS